MEKDSPLLLDVDTCCADKIAPANGAGGNGRESAGDLRELNDSPIAPQIALARPLPTEFATAVSRQLAQANGVLYASSRN